MKKGFTLIELLIVIAVIGILAGVILISTSSGKDKAKMAAFKSETRGSYSGLATACTTTGAAITAPADTVTTNWGAFTLACSPSGRFTITATPLPAVTGCTATINENGATYTAQCV